MRGQGRIPYQEYPQQFLEMPEPAFSPLQTDYEEALLLMGEYRSKSEIARAAIRCLWHHLPPEKRVRAAVGHYAAGRASINKAALLAGLPFVEMKRILQEEDVLQTSHADSEKSQAAADKFAAP